MIFYCISETFTEDIVNGMISYLHSLVKKLKHGAYIHGIKRKHPLIHELKCFLKFKSTKCEKEVKMVIEALKTLTQNYMECSYSKCTTRRYTNNGDRTGNWWKCGGCKMRWYCSRRCQKKDWPNHVKDCYKKTKPKEKKQENKEKKQQKQQKK